MNWNETVASACRYGEVAERIFGEAEIIWEHSESDYQGSANILARMPDGTFVHYEWAYGSCSGCDEWEDRGLSDAEIEAEMRNAAAWLPGVEVALRYMKLEAEFSDATVPTAQSPTAGSIPGMLRYLAGGSGEEFKEMGAAFIVWCNEQGLVPTEGLVH